MKYVIRYENGADREIAANDPGDAVRIAKAYPGLVKEIVQFGAMPEPPREGEQKPDDRMIRIIASRKK
jgi:hypothetical protein